MNVLRCGISNQPCRLGGNCPAMAVSRAPNRLFMEVLVRNVDNQLPCPGPVIPWNQH